eukprot:627040-Amphidinium_carterae.1
MNIFIGVLSSNYDRYEDKVGEAKYALELASLRLLLGSFVLSAKESSSAVGASKGRSETCEQSVVLNAL